MAIGKTQDAETVFVYQVEFAYNRVHAVGPVQNRKENRLASVDPNYNFDCPECEERLSVSSEKIGDRIHCNHCGENIHVPGPPSMTDKLIAGMLDDDEFEHPGSLKIDGIADDAGDGSSWHIRCHICDSTLLVTSEQVGKKVKCNDCYSMIPVLPNADAAKLAAEVKDGSDLEIVVEEVSSNPAVIPPPPETRKKAVRDSGELTLAPAPELASEIKEAQKEIFLDELVEEVPPEITLEHLVEDEDGAIELMEPVATSNVSPMFGLGAPNAAEEDDEEDSDEMIEMLDVAPEELNQPATFTAPATPEPAALPRMPRKKGKGKQPKSIPVEGGEKEKPIRVHAKRKPKTAKRASNNTPARKGFQFDEASLSNVLEKAMGLLKTGNIWIWALVSIAVMAVGSSIWHWISPHNLDTESVTLASKLMSWAAGSIFGLGIYFAGYVILLFVCGVIFRETAQGKTKVDSVSVSSSADFTSTMLLFGFSMAIAALPCMLFGYMWISLPIQFLLAGCFLFAAWENQAAFSIISGNIFRSFSKHSDSWKKWFVGAAISIGGGFFGGLLLEVNMPIISVFTSIAGSVVLTFATLLYAVITGWHCGNVVNKMKLADAE